MTAVTLTSAQMLAAAEFTPDEFGVYTAGYVEGHRVGLAVGHWLGFAEGYDTHANEVSNWLAGTPQALKQPLLSEVQAARVVDHQPCIRKCRACSRCIHSLAWYGRGGRDFLGVEQERALAAESGAGKGSE